MKCTGRHIPFQGVTSLRDCAYKCTAYPIFDMFGYGSDCEIGSTCKCECYESEMGPNGARCKSGQGPVTSTDTNLYNFIDGE